MIINIIYKNKTYLFWIIFTLSIAYIVKSYDVYNNVKQAYIELANKQTAFTLNDMEVKGLSPVQKQKVLSIINKEAKKNNEATLLESCDFLKNVNWIKSCKAKRTLSHSLSLEIKVRSVIAYLQENDTIHLLADDNSILDPEYIEVKNNLPIVVGKDSIGNAAQFIHELQKFNHIKKNLFAIRKIHNRRWDIFISKELVVKLPEKNYFSALIKLEKWLEEHHDLNEHVLSLDFRLKDKFILKLKDKRYFRPKSSFSGQET